MGKTRIASMDDLEKQGRLAVSVNGVEVMLVLVEEKVHAINRYCPHAGQDLMEARLEGTSVVCSRHEGTFSLETGKFIDNGYVSPLLAKNIKDAMVHDISVEDGWIFIHN
ncbi:Rieske 2Fe-2S domain-containing protein [Candidatus Bathyarchaeota archaeon]|nr:Rieske 2Fe-2S domain-containing protein [Candidatus Bathyarchaeota archaeon]